MVKYKNLVNKTDFQKHLINLLKINTILTISEPMIKMLTGINEKILD